MSHAALETLSGKNILVMGLGGFGGGEGVARFLVAQGANVTITDAKPAEKLDATLKRLAGLPLTYRLGEHRPEDFETCDALVVNPAVKPENEFVQIVEKRGAPILTEIGLFVSHCKGRILGVTGSKGKSTTASLLAAFLARHPDGRKTRLGGNIGRSLLDALDQIEPHERVVLELSSFQLYRLGQQHWSPPMALWTLLFPDRLDGHGSMHDYIEAKSQILRHQRPEDLAILQENSERREVIEASVKGRMALISDEKVPALGAFLEHGTSTPGQRGQITLVNGNQHETLCIRNACRLRGDHNLFNIAQAAFAAWIEGVPAGRIEDTLHQFEPLPHRLELVATIDGVEFVNDSISTTPQASAAGMRAFAGRRLHVIAGGSDKGLEYDDWGLETTELATRVFLLGEIAGKLQDAVLNARRRSQTAHLREICMVSSLEEAIQSAAEGAKPGDVVLLAPATASYDMFRNFEERGEAFRAIVQARQGG